MWAEVESSGACTRQRYFVEHGLEFEVYLQPVRFRVLLSGRNR